MVKWSFVLVPGFEFFQLVVVGMYSFSDVRPFPEANRAVIDLDVLHDHGYEAKMCCDQSGSDFNHIVSHFNFARLEELHGTDISNKFLKATCVSFLEVDKNKRAFKKLWVKGVSGFNDFRVLNKFLQGDDDDFCDPLLFTLIAMATHCHVSVFFGDGFIWTTVGKQKHGDWPEIMLVLVYVGLGRFLLADRMEQASGNNMAPFIEDVVVVEDDPDVCEQVPCPSKPEWSALVNDVLGSLGHMPDFIAEEQREADCEPIDVDVVPVVVDNADFNLKECSVVLQRLSKANVDSVVSAQAGPKFIPDVDKFPCQVCNCEFSQNSKLRKHIRTRHNLVTCSVPKCILAFNSEKEMRLHALIHLPSPVKCHVCDHVFVSLGQLKKHSLKHSQVKGFRCNACAKTFKRQHELRQHKQAKHETKIYPCKDCGKQFACFRYLRLHLKRSSCTT